MDDWQEEEARRTAEVLSLPLREDYAERLQERMDAGETVGVAVDRLLREGRGDERSDGLLRHFASEENMRYIATLWERDCEEMKRGRDADGYLECILSDKCPSVLEVRDEMRAVADGVYDAMGMMYSRPNDCQRLLRDIIAALKGIKESLPTMSFLRVDYSDVEF